MPDIQLQVDPSCLALQAAIDQIPVLDRADKIDFSGLCLDILTPENKSERFPVCGQIEVAIVSDCTIQPTDRHTMIKARADHVHMQADLNLDLTTSGTQVDVDLSLNLDGHGWLAAAGLALPLAQTPDPLCRRTTVGGEHREETWRLDQNDEDDSEEWQRRVSDTKARWPWWRIGGLLVDAPHHYLIWKSNATTTPALSMDEGQTCPGWISYTTSSYALHIQWHDMHQQAPAGMTIDSEHGLLWLWLHPPAVRPRFISKAITLAADMTITVETL